MTHDLAPLKIKRSDYKAIGVYYYPDFDETVLRQLRETQLARFKRIKPRYICGVWKLTSIYSIEFELTLDDIKKEIYRKILDNRAAIIERLRMSGTGGKTSNLKPTQYKTFYNFLINLK